MRNLSSALVAPALGSLALLVASNGEAAPPQVHPDAIDLAPLMEDHVVAWPALPTGADTPGMIAAVVAGNHIIARGNAGWARLGGVDPVAMPHDAVFNIGSISKTITALALAKLIESGVILKTNPTVYLSWDTTIADALELAPDYFHSFFLDDTDRASVTLKQVASHRSGYNCQNKYYQHDWPNDWHTKTRPQLAEGFLVGTVAADIGAGQYPDGALGDCPGTINVEHYENLNFLILQAVINKWLPAGVHDYTEYVEEHVIKPHEMNAGWAWGRSDLMAASGLDNSSGNATIDNYWNAHFFPDPVWASGHHYPRYYDDVWEVKAIAAPAYGDGASLRENGIDSIATGAGGFAFTVYDLARYATLLMRDRSPAIQKMLQRDHGGYAHSYAWKSYNHSTSPQLAARGYTHNGAISAGSYARIWFSPDLDLAYISFANGGEAPDYAADNVKDRMMYHLDGTVLDTGGCADTGDVKHVQRFYNQKMFGCAGSVTYPQASSLCKIGYHVCTAAEFSSYNQYTVATTMENAEAPMDHYWTSTNLKYSGSSSGNCSASTAAAASSCNTNEPMRVCSPTAEWNQAEYAYEDTQGNHCNWINCGYNGSTSNRYFGGCNGNPTAGTLCCEDEISGPPQ